MTRVALFSLLFLSACANRPQIWTGPPGFTADQFERQLSQCNSLADTQFRQDLVSRHNTIFDCMSGAGYDLRDVKQ